MRDINLIIIHCSATQPSQDIGVAEIKKWHTDKKPYGNGWKDIGYHYVIRRNGNIENGRTESQVGSHTAGHNATSLGICMVGGINRKGHPEANFTPAQWDSLNRLVRILRARYPKTTVHGHNEYSKKACPSFDVQEWLREIV